MLRQLPYAAAFAACCCRLCCRMLPCAAQSPASLHPLPVPPARPCWLHMLPCRIAASYAAATACCPHGRPNTLIEQAIYRTQATKRQWRKLTLNGLLGGAEAQANVLVPPQTALAHNLLGRLVVAAGGRQRRQGWRLVSSVLGLLIRLPLHNKAACCGRRAGLGNTSAGVCAAAACHRPRGRRALLPAPHGPPQRVPMPCSPALHGQLPLERPLSLHGRRQNKGGHPQAPANGALVPKALQQGLRAPCVPIAHLPGPPCLLSPLASFQAAVLASGPLRLASSAERGR